MQKTTKLGVKVNFICLLFFLLFTISNVNLLQAQSANALVLKGQREYEANNIEAALEFFELALEKDSKNYTAAYFAGVSYLRLALPRKALYRLNIIDTNQFRLTKDVYVWLAFANFKNDRFNEAKNNIAQHRKKHGKLLSEDIEELERNIVFAQRFYDDKKNYKIENLGNNINSENPEYAAILTADHRTIHFTTRRKENKGGEKSGEYTEDILSSSLNENDEWRKAQRLRGLVTVDHDATVQLFGDDDKMMIYQKKDLFISELKNGKWTSPKSIGNEINKKQSRESHGFISSDGKTLIFSSDYKTQDENLDLFISKLDDNGKWGKPMPIEELNTDKDEDSPFITEDGTMYFSSRGHNSMGGFDIFKTRFNPSTQKFDTPENMGYPLNSVSDDIFFNEKNGIGYFTSNRSGGMGREDIYRVYLFEKVNVSLEFLTASNKEPIENAVAYLQSGDKKIALETNEEGKINTILPAFQEFTVQLVKDGNTLFSTELSPVTSLKDPTNFVSSLNIPQKQEELVASSNTQNDNANVDVERSNMSNNQLKLKRLYFEHNQVMLNTEAIEKLDKVLAFLKENTSVKAEISGHTDSIGPKDYNQNLASMRTRTVLDYLLENGIDKSRLETKSYGESQPLVSNDDEQDGREINRRIELKFWQGSEGAISKN